MGGWIRSIPYVLCAILVGGCGDPAPTYYDGPKSFRIGGQVSGLDGAVGLVLQLNDAHDLVVTDNGDFAFATAVAVGHDYDVTVLRQPSAPAQTCLVRNGSGLVGVGHVFDVSVHCETNAYQVGGTVRGTGRGVITLQNNGRDDFELAGDGPFRFYMAVASGAAYDVTVAVAPAGKRCSVDGGTGIMGAGDVAAITVTCVDAEPDDGARPPTP